jgi:hypothetical protein
MTTLIIDGDVLLYMSIWGNDTLEEAQDTFKEIFVDIQMATFSSDYVMALGGPDNFRNDLYSEYKASKSRVKSKSSRPEWFIDLKSWVVETMEGAVLSENCEADDMVRIWHLELDAVGKPYCVVTVDKDLDCCYGSHYNPRTKQIYHITKEYAMRFYYKQLLMGDSVDNIPGIRGIGPKKADKILEGIQGKLQLKQAVCCAYQEAYGDSGFDHMLLNGKLLHIWRKINDHFTLGKEVYQTAIEGRDWALDNKGQV